MATSKIINTDKIRYVDYDIESNTTEQIFDMPSGMTNNNSVFVGARVLTKFGTVVSDDYDGGAYFGNLRFLTSGKFGFTPQSAGNATHIYFYFYQD